MDYKIMMMTFGMVFLAELGDKTQLATFCLSADCDPKMSVFIGASLALVLSSLVAVFLGATASRYVPQLYVQLGAGVFFLAAGIWTLTSAIRSITAT